MKKMNEGKKQITKEIWQSIFFYQYQYLNLCEKYFMYPVYIVQIYTASL